MKIIELNEFNCISFDTKVYFLSIFGSFQSVEKTLFRVHKFSIEITG